MENQNNQLWFNNVNTLFSRNNFFDIIPLIDMDYNEKVNAITRFCVYLSIILIVFTGNLNYLYIPLSVILLFYLVHIFRPKEGFSEHRIMQKIQIIQMKIQIIQIWQITI